MSGRARGPLVLPQPSRADIHRKPSLRWRLRRWILKKLDAWPRARPEPTTEWGELRRAERIRLQAENARLRALEDRLMRYLAFADADRDRAAMGPRAAGFEEALGNIRCYVLDGRLDEMLADFAECGDELAAEYVRGPSS